MTEQRWDRAEPVQDGPTPHEGRPTQPPPTAASAPPSQPTTGANPYQPYPPYQPYQPYQQPYQPAPATARPSRVGRTVLILVAAVLLALCSGLVGGLVVYGANGGAKPSGIRTAGGAPAPQVDRSSVAGVAETVLPSVVDINVGTGEGSGVVYSADGVIVTNNHVVAAGNGSAVDVTFNDGKTARASIVGTDPLGDVAVIKVQGVTGLTPAKFGNSSKAHVGDTVLAVGSPLGLQGSVTEGIVSALHRTIREDPTSGQGGSHSISDAIQTDAAINPGNSGGALVNMASEVIGINTAIATSGQASGNIGVGFAISSNKVKAAADQLLKGVKVSHPYLGVSLTDAPGGALVADVVAGGPADKAGLQKGDLVTKAGSSTTKDANDLINAVQAAKPGDKLPLTVRRNGADQQVTVTLGDTP